MLAYVIRRTLYVVPVVLGVAVIIFLIFNLVGGDPVYQILGRHASPEAVAEMRAQLGLDRPLHVQFWDYLTDLARLDFGRSLKTRQRISQMILQGAIPSLSLTLPAFVLGTVIAISISLFCAYARGTAADRWIVLVSVLAMSVSSLAYIIFGQYVLAYKLQLFPVWGYEYGIGALEFLVLPILIWLMLAVGPDVRFYRTMMLDEVGQDYVRTALSKGVSRNRVLFKHVLKNAMIPVITQVIVSIPFLFTGSLLLENFFGIPGLGNMTVNAIFAADWPVIRAMTFIDSVLFILFNLASDVLYTVVDPRVVLR